MSNNICTPIHFIVGESIHKIEQVETPFSEKICLFLNELSRNIRKEKEINLYPDVASFAFFCRAANIQTLKKQHSSLQHIVRRGLGTIFHITPSNIPTNFAYSLVASLLAGNANILRVTNHKFPQIELICTAINKTLNTPEHFHLKKFITIITYERNTETTKYLSSIADGRIIWGGDETILKLREIPLPPRSIELTFADRYSFSIINSDSLIKQEQKIYELASKFYNDTYLTGQNACSSPHLICWLGSNSKEIAQKFWDELAKLSIKKFKITPIDVYDKLSQLSIDLSSNNEVCGYKNYKNYLHIIFLKKLPKNVTNLRCHSGYFYNVEVNNINDIANIINKKVQTITYYGINKYDLQKFIENNSISGIDRIVPIGNSLHFSLIWDGFDLINSLSRKIEII